MAVRDGRGDVKQTTRGFWVRWWCNPSPLPKANSYPYKNALARIIIYVCFYNKKWPPLGGPWSLESVAYEISISLVWKANQ